MLSQEQSKVIDEAFDAFSVAYDAHNLGSPPERITEENHIKTWLIGIGGAFMEDQYGPVEPLIDGTLNQEYFKGVQAEIRSSTLHPSQETRELANAFGRWQGTLYDTGAIGWKQSELRLSGGHIVYPGRRVPCSLRYANVVEYGMGVRGLLSHVSNLRAGVEEYKVTHISNSKFENLVLDGMADYFGVSHLFSLEHNGISATVVQLAEDERYVGKVDAVLASRVHCAEDLIIGIDTACSSLLRAGGAIALRGPRYHPAPGTSYDDAAKAVIKAFGDKSVVANERFTTSNKAGSDEFGRTTIARRPGGRFKRLLGIKPVI